MYNVIGLKKGAAPKVFDDLAVICLDLNSCSQGESEHQIDKSTHSEQNIGNENTIQLDKKLLNQTIKYDTEMYVLREN